MDKEKVRELRVEAQSLRSTVRIGKEGLTEKVVDEVARQLKKSKLVKVKLLPSAAGDARTLATELATASSSVLVEVRGRTAVLARE